MAAGSVTSREARAGWLFLLPWIVGFLAFTAGPMLYSLWLSLTHYDMLKPPTYVGLENYREAVADERVGTAMWNTVFFTVLHVPAQIALALGLASLLRRAGRTAGFFRTIVYLPVMTPPVALAALFLLLLNGQNGAVNEFLSWFGFTGPNWTTDPAWIKPGLVVMSLWTVGSTAVLYLAALTRVPLERYEAARLDGASPWRQFWHVTLPGISGTVYFTVVVNTIASLQVFTEAYAMYFGARAKQSAEGDAALFYVIHLFQEAFGSLRMGYASALAWFLFAVIAVVTFVQVRVSRRYVHNEGERP
ncbi:MULTISPECIES: carbohydrate ABC transporter permease [Saccharothrix]|uniref:Spermidine/putrescine ABC transporter permease n=1 Tax=Saccharothrix yanglingensis TaxID=659496 RepID=A0ABU0X2R7_9PSEU|nr:MULTISPECIES: sugar ABC transporter permease [Saccharothrix]MDQ2586436.1 spermidine/putrescine ABC transporter permease [Saccharothrix yanglingensis]MDU0291321.1 sugar ABC transporter permease [Saccharothrix longispora]